MKDNKLKQLKNQPKLVFVASALFALLMVGYVLAQENDEASAKELQEQLTIILTSSSRIAGVNRLATIQSCKLLIRETFDEPCGVGGRIPSAVETTEVLIDLAGVRHIGVSINSSGAMLQFSPDWGDDGASYFTETYSNCDGRSYRGNAPNGLPIFLNAERSEAISQFDFETLLNICEDQRIY